MRNKNKIILFPIHYLETEKDKIEIFNVESYSPFIFFLKQRSYCFLKKIFLNQKLMAECRCHNYNLRGGCSCHLQVGRAAAGTRTQRQAGRPLLLFLRLSSLPITVAVTGVFPPSQGRLLSSTSPVK